MTRSYHLLLALVCLLLIQPTIGRKAWGKPSSGTERNPREDDRTGRVRTHMAAGFIDDRPVQREAPPRWWSEGKATEAAGSQRKTPVRGTSGPVHTYIKTDKNANFKWGVRHFVGKAYAR
ncbi:uncharacterized protein LOC128724825 [Anopheles nili]|uniref:uncharacterized protein LOC128724825 n=1 Tax=Anopheles nili TaxID=185578 RepID=UPI00237C41AE|nr:uncharacterized protein LOC128724825 [Anopheles nili]